MQEIAVLSDTHISKPDANLKGIFKEGGAFNKIETVIHAGDFTTVDIVDFIEENSSKFYGVQGNMDDYDIRGRLPVKKIIEVKGIRVGLTHGWGPPYDLRERVYEYFDDPSLDCIVFGHSHKPNNSYIRNTLMFNPGSFKGSLFSTGRTAGKLILEKGGVKGEIIRL